MKLRSIFSLVLAIIMISTAGLTAFADDPATVYDTPVEVIDGETFVWDPDRGEFVKVDMSVLDGNLEVEITQDLQDTNYSALTVNAVNDDSSFQVTGSVSREETREEYSYPSTVFVGAEGDNSSSATIKGDVYGTVICDGEGDEAQANPTAVYVQTMGTGTNSASATIEGTVSVTGIATKEGGDAFVNAVSTKEFDKKSQIDVKVGKDVIATANAVDSAYADAINVLGSGTTTVIVDGNTNAKATSSDYSASARSIETDLEPNGVANIHVKGNAVTEIKNNAENGHGDATTIHVNSSLNSKSVITVDGNAIAKSDDNRNINAIYTGAIGKDGLSDITVGKSATGNISSTVSNGATSKINIGENVNGEIELYASDGGKVNMQVGKDVSGDVFISAYDKGNIEFSAGGSVNSDKNNAIVINEYNGNSKVHVSVANDVQIAVDDGRPNGILVNQYGEKAEANVEVGGNVQVTSTDDYIDIFGVAIDQMNEGNNTVVGIGGSVVVETQGECADTTALRVSSSSGESMISVGHDLIAKTNQPDDCTSKGIDVGASDSIVTIDVNGGIYTDSPTNSTGVLVDASKAKVNISVNDGIAVKADSGNGIGVQTTYAESVVNIEVLENGITVNPQDNDSNSGSAVYLENLGGTINLDINGDVEAFVGISIGGRSNVVRETINDGIAPTIVEDELVEQIPIYHDETIVGYEYVYYNAEAGYYYNDAGEKWHEVDTTSKGRNHVIIDGDVTAERNGISFHSTDDVVTSDVIIDGTLYGKENAVVYYKDAEIENLTLTVWKVEENKRGNLVEKYKGVDDDGNRTYEADREAEKQIQYIIRIADNSMDYITTTGTTEYEGYHVAHEGDTITLKLNIPEGKEIVEAYADAGQTVRLLKDADGNYYLIIPRGGGVELSLSLREIPVVSAEKEEAEEDKTVIQPAVWRIFNLKDKTGKAEIEFLSNKTYKVHYEDEKSETGRFVLDGDNIVLIDSVMKSTNEHEMPIGYNSETSKYDLTFQRGIDPQATFEFEFTEELINKLKAYLR